MPPFLRTLYTCATKSRFLSVFRLHPRRMLNTCIGPFAACPMAHGHRMELAI